MVLAYSSSGYTNINHEGVNTSGASGSLYIFEETTALTTIRGQLDSWANLSLGIAKPNVPSIGTIFTPAYYWRQFRSIRFRGLDLFSNIRRRISTR